MNGGGFSTETLSGLLGAQEDQSDTLASSIIDEADTDGDGKLSAAEIAASMGLSDVSEIEDVFAALDTDGDGTASADELSVGLEASRPQGPPPPRGGPPPSASEMASSLLDAADSDQSGSLGLGEIASALGQDEGDLTDVFATLDGNGDGALGSDELTSAIQSMFSRQMAAYAAPSWTASSSVSLAA
jgi:Ca2+-binding EF-hand superfamily protein